MNSTHRKLVKGVGWVLIVIGSLYPVLLLLMSLITLCIFMLSGDTPGLEHLIALVRPLVIAFSLALVFVGVQVKRIAVAR